MIQAQRRERSGGAEAGTNSHARSDIHAEQV
jgi:hypothetical protein